MPLMLEPVISFQLVTNQLFPLKYGKGHNVVDTNHRESQPESQAASDLKHMEILF